MLDRKIRKKIEWAFRNYSTLQKQGADYIVELAEQGTTPAYGLVGGGHAPGNPTESKGIKAAENNAMLWCKVVENTLTTFRWDIEYELIKMFYFEKKSRTRVCERLGVAERTFTYWTENIMNYAYQWVQEYKLM
ncbi:MAG: hypothetical protein HFK08_08420 [Clostridia bacterium]|jgi:hypothetical protein|nr:hypothetical protein [Clostridia bacterium]